MKKYLVDTTVFIDHLRNKPWATAFLNNEDLAISAVSIAELFQGARNKSELIMIQKLVDQFEVNWGSVQINRLAIQLIKQYFLKNNLKFLDALIAATALKSNLILATDNMKHFEFITGLKVVLPKKLFI